MIQISKPLICSCLSINFRFAGRVSKSTKTSNKDHLFYNKVLFKNFILQASSHLRIQKIYASSQPETLLTLQIFQKTFLWLVLDKTFALHYLCAPKNYIFKALGKQISGDFPSIFYHQ